MVISRHQGLLSNVTRELDYGRAVALIGPERVKELSWFRPGDPELGLDAAIDAALLSEDILELYRAFRRTIRFTPDDIVPAHRGDVASFQRLAQAMPSEVEIDRDGESIGSNNWVVGGSRTLSGFPFMANDPHRVQQAPSLRYWVHLVAPGWNVIGGGEPVLPGVSIGHNEHGAWGLTVFGQDNEDLYVYDTNPSDPSQYRYLDRWEAMQVIEETIAVKDEPAVTVELKYTRHGPVLFEDTASHTAYALRAAWMDIGSAAVSRQPAHGPGNDMGRVSRRLQLQSDSVGKHGLGRHRQEHRVSGRRRVTDSAELERPRAGAWGWSV